jgi:periplasmic copper chaperone A
MMMRELADGLELPAGEVVTLAPGGLHLMFLDLPEPLEAGESFELVLEFEKAGTRTLSVEILDAAP